MAMFSFFKGTKHQKYDYKPQYYSPMKDDLDQRYGKTRATVSNDTEAVKTRISNGLRRKQRGSSSFRKKEVFRSNMILLGTIIFLIAFTFFFLLKYLPIIVKMVG